MTGVLRDEIRRLTILSKIEQEIASELQRRHCRSGPESPARIEAAKALSRADGLRKQVKALKRSLRASETAPESDPPGE